jgi:GT2 family glycosyltransferase
VILHYIALEETIKCVDSIVSNVYGEKRIVIVDNFSPNDSYARLKEYYLKSEIVDVIQTNSNLGFANGNNFGYSHSVSKYNPEFIVVMNNDMEIRQKDFIEKINRCYEEQKFHIMGPDIYSTKKQYHQNPQTRKLPTLNELKKARRELSIKDKMHWLIRIKWILKKNSDRTNSIEPIKNDNYVDHVVINPMLHGSCYVFSKRFIERHQNGCFYNKTFMYMEAEILYYQALRDKEKIVYCPDLRVYHHEDVSTDATYQKQYKKSIFSIRCLLQSTDAFIHLMEEDMSK